MKYDLHLMERLTLLDVLPKEGSFATLKMIRKLRETLGLNEDEIKKYEVVQDIEKNQIRWNVKKAAEPAQIEVPEFATEMIKATLKKLDADSKLEERHFTLYEIFVEGKQDANN